MNKDVKLSLLYKLEGFSSPNHDYFPPKKSHFSGAFFMSLPVLCILTSKSRRLFMTSSPPPPFFIQRTKARARKLAQELQKEAETLQACHCQLTALQSYGNNLRNGWQKKTQFFDCPCLPRTIFSRCFLLIV